MARIFISQPCTGGLVHQKTVITAQSITFDHEPHFKYIENCSLVTKARQDHFAMFVQQKHDFLLTIDADMVVGPPGILDGMIERLPDNSIVGGTYAMKAHTPDGTSPMNGCMLNKGEKAVLDGRLMPMRWLPSGFLLIPRKIALKMVEAYKDLEYEDHIVGKCWAVYNTMLLTDDEGVRRFLPEDFSFCERAKNIGINIFCDTNIVLGHIGSYLYHVEHLRVQQQPIRQKPSTMVSVSADLMKVKTEDVVKVDFSKFKK